MSDLTATNCGCAATTSNNCGNGCGSFIWIILLLSCCGGSGSFLGSNNCGCDNNGCGNLLGGNGNSCEWLIWILLISCFCGNNNSCC